MLLWSFLYYFHMSSLPDQKIHSHGNTAFSTTSLSSLQHALTAVMQQSKYCVFYDKDTPI